MRKLSSGHRARNQQRELGFLEDLVLRGVRAATADSKDLWSTEPVAVVRREIALITSQISRLESVAADWHRQVVRIECYVATDLLSLAAMTPRYAPPRLSEAHALKGRLHRLGEERRRLSKEHEVQLRSLEQRLLTLLDQLGTLREVQ